MKVKYVHHRAREVFPVDHPGFLAEPGKTYDKPAKVARSLLEQPAIWQPADDGSIEKKEDS